jgi:hypothetical protein
MFKLIIMPKYMFTFSNNYSNSGILLKTEKWMIRLNANYDDACLAWYMVKSQILSSIMPCESIY